MLRTSRAQPFHEFPHSVIPYLGIVIDIFQNNCLVAIVEDIRINRPKSKKYNGQRQQAAHSDCPDQRFQ